MSLLAPDRLLWLLAVVPIVGLYILKTRLRRRQVSTLLFWDQIFEEKRQRTLWRNLRHWLSLLVQLLIVTLVVIALADPLWNLNDDSGQELILIVDNSASMQAVVEETGRTRLEDAIEKAHGYLKSVRAGDHCLLLSAGSTVDVVVGRTDFAPAVAEGLARITPTDGPTRVVEAVEMAKRLCNDEERRRILVFSDGQTPGNEGLLKSSEVHWLPVGDDVDNVAITAFNARRSVVDPIGYSLFFEVTNFSNEPVEGRLTLKLAGSLVDVIPYSLEPDASYRQTFSGTSQVGGILEATLAADDGLAADNIAQAVIPARPKIPVLLVSNAETENYYLNTVLESIPLLEVRRITAEAALPKSSSRQLVVYDRIVPDTLPEGPALFVIGDGDGPEVPKETTSAPIWTAGPRLEAPLIVEQAEQHPLLRHVHLENVLLQGGRNIAVSEVVGPVTELLKAADDSVLLTAVEREAGRLLILSGDLEAGDLPLRIAFPVMMTNAVNWFLRQSNEFTPTLTTGTANRVAWHGSSDQRESTQTPVGPFLLNPEGTQMLVPSEQDVATVGPVDRIGIYGLLPVATVTAEGEPPQTAEQLAEEQPDVLQTLLAVNLCNAAESDLRISAPSEETLTEPPAASFPAWLLLTLISLLVVLWEWRAYQRRIIA